jgi:single-stranded-DNA-specific exonuclease
MPGVHPLVVQLLHNRGLTQPGQIEVFLSNDKRAEVDPFLLPDMHQAHARVYQALLRGEKVVIYGDFDADGITATALLVQGLSAMGGTVFPYIPHRSNEGYGVKTTALEKIHQQGATLVITVDTGITAFAEVQKAHKAGLDIVITDHHIPPEKLPPASAVVDPKRLDSVYPFSELAGVGVAFKLLQSLGKSLGREDEVNSLSDLVALGTVTDMVPLINENRFWVKAGLEIINKTQRLGLQEMMRYANMQPGNLDAQSISWQLGPRINAAGRIDNASTSYRLLMTDDQQEASNLAREIEGKNAERLRMTNELLDKANKVVVESGTDAPLLMAGDETYSSGVMGLVAGRLADRYYRPVILVKTGKETCRGSGRSIDEFNLMSALQECQDLLSNFGGHTRAAGFNVPTAKFPEFRKRMTDIARERLAGLDLRPHINIDAEVHLSVFSGDTYKQIQRLAPFGSGNPMPLFVSRHVEVIGRWPFGNQGDHLKLKLRQGDAVWDAICFGMGECNGEITKFIDMAYTVELNRWNGEESLRLNLSDFEPVK